MTQTAQPRRDMLWRALQRARGVLALSAPVFVGALVMAVYGALPSRWAGQVTVGALGLLLYAGICALPKRSPSPAQSPTRPRADLCWIGAALAVAGVASTLLGEGIEGVHRWSALGPLRLHMSALLTPALLVFSAQHSTARHLTPQPYATHLVLLCLQAVHIAQPDAGQATALGVGAAALSLSQRSPTGYALAAAHVVIASLAWLRPDPLAPVVFVEGVLQLAVSASPFLAVLSLAAMALGVAAPLLSNADKRPALALSAYLAAAALVTLWAEFPTPLLGFSPSITLGAFAALGALSRSRGD